MYPIYFRQLPSLLIFGCGLAVFRTVAEAADRPYSHVVVTTKALPDVSPLPSLLAPLLAADNTHPLPAFVILQNGLSVERDIYNTIKQLGREEPKVISTALWIGTNLRGDNVVEHGHAVRLTAETVGPL